MYAFVRMMVEQGEKRCGTQPERIAVKCATDCCARNIVCGRVSKCRHPNARPEVGGARYHTLWAELQSSTTPRKRGHQTKIDVISERPPRDGSKAPVFETICCGALELLKIGQLGCGIFYHLRYLGTMFEPWRPQQARQAREKILATHPPPPPRPYPGDAAYVKERLLLLFFVGRHGSLLDWPASFS